ncbi:MAG TPA: glycosyltransferase family 39 protein [Candidatus Obscuribacterales bacterium]
MLPANSHRFLILLITLAGLAVRLWLSDWGGLSADEANGVAIAVTGSWADMVQHLREDGNPPLFYALLRVFNGLFGSSDAALRLMSVIASTALVPVAYLVARKLAGDAVAVPVALVTALCPPIIRYGTMVRMYWLLPILSLVSTYLFIRLLAKPPGKGLRAGYVLSTALLIYCHHWGFIVALGQTATAGLGLVRRWWSWRELVPFVCCLALAGLAYLPWLPSLHYTLTHDESPWAQSPALTHLIIETPPEALVGRLSFRHAWSELGIMYAAFWVAFSLVFAGRLPVGDPSPDQPGRHSPEERQRSLNLLRWVVVFGLGGALALSSIKAAWRDRYLVAFSPALIVLYCAVLSPFLRRLPRPAAALLPALIWLPAWIPQYLWLDAMPESSAWAISDKIRRQCDRSRDLVVVSWEAAAPALSRTLPDAIPMIAFPDMERVAIVRWDGINARLRDDRRLFALFDRMKQVLDRRGTIWLVDSSHGTGVVAPPGSVSLAGMHYLAVEQLRMDQIRSWLKLNARQEDTFVWAPGRDISLFLSRYRQASPGEVAGAPGGLRQEQAMPEAVPAESGEFERGRP